jgi:hypothetical protein
MVGEGSLHGELGYHGLARTGRGRHQDGFIGIQGLDGANLEFVQCKGVALLEALEIGHRDQFRGVCWFDYWNCRTTLRILPPGARSIV